MSPALLRRLSLAVGAVILLDAQHPMTRRAQFAAWEPSQVILLEGTVVTMNGARDVLPQGRVLVRDGRIVAVWDGPIPPTGTNLDSVVRPELGPKRLDLPRPELSSRAEFADLKSKGVLTDATVIIHGV